MPAREPEPHGAELRSFLLGQRTRAAPADGPRPRAQLAAEKMLQEDRLLGLLLRRAAEELEAAEEATTDAAFEARAAAERDADGASERPPQPRKGWALAGRLAGGRG